MMFPAAGGSEGVKARRLILLALLLAPLAGCPQPPRDNGPVVADPSNKPGPRPKPKPKPKPRAARELVVLDALDWSSKYLSRAGLKLKRGEGSVRLAVRDTEQAAAAIAGACLALRRRMGVIAQNLSNAETSRLPTTPAGTPARPYRRKALQVAASGALEVVEDKSPLRKVYRPGHPDADKDGNVLLPNVYVAVELHDWRSSLEEYEVLRLALGALSSMYVAPPARLFREPVPPQPYEFKKSSTKPAKPATLKPKPVPIKKP